MIKPLHYWHHVAILPDAKPVVSIYVCAMASGLGHEWLLFVLAGVRLNELNELGPLDMLEVVVIAQRVQSRIAFHDPSQAILDANPLASRHCRSDKVRETEATTDIEEDGVSSECIRPMFWGFLEELSWPGKAIDDINETTGSIVTIAKVNYIGPIIDLCNHPLVLLGVASGKWLRAILMNIMLSIGFLIFG